MIPLAAARTVVLEGCPPLSARPIALDEALGCVTAEPVVASEPVPAFANTAMDGYAVRAADTVGAPVRLAVAGTLAAGTAPDTELGPGQAVRIMTGAPIPPGCDAVVMVERTRTEGAEVVIEEAASPGDHLRQPGEDIAAGQEVFPARTVLGPGHLGVLASLGRGAVVAFPRARVGVLSTGDELVDGPAELRPGQIRDSNRPTLLALVRQSGFTPVDLGLIADDDAAIAVAVEDGLAMCDALVTSGGVSVGDFDYMKAVLERLGTLRSWRVAIKPAKPLAFGVVAGKPVFGLPGNPVSSMVSFELFARPALRQMAGHRRLFRTQVDAVATEAVSRRPDGKLHLVRVIARLDDDGRWRVRPVGGQGSHQLAATAAANALALVPDGDGVPAGATVKAVVLADDDLC